MQTEYSPSPGEQANSQEFHLLAQIEAGDESALATLYDRHCGLIYSIARRVCHDSTLAEEVLQHVFLDLWRSPVRFAFPKDSLLACLSLASRNCAIKLMRKRRSTQGVPSAAPVLRNQAGHRPRTSSFPNAERELLEMAFFEGKTPFEIAKETGYPLSTIARRIACAVSSRRIGASPGVDVAAKIAHGGDIPSPAAIEI